MSKIKQKSIKVTARQIYKLLPEQISKDFYVNKIILSNIMEGGNKKFRNRVAGELVNIKNKEGRVIMPPYRGIKDKRKLKKDVKTFKK